jgi:hypothetical protein
MASCPGFRSAQSGLRLLVVRSTGSVWPAAEFYVARVPAVVPFSIVGDLFTTVYAPTISRIAVDIAQDFSQARILIVHDPRRIWWKKPSLNGRAAFGGH